MSAAIPLKRPMKGQNPYKCRNGHRRTPDNLHPVRKGNKVSYLCKKCLSEKHRRAWVKRKAAANARRMEWVHSRGTLPPGDPRHGKLTGYNDWRCRCERCKAAIREYQRKRKERLRREKELIELDRLVDKSERWHVSYDARFGGDGSSQHSEWDDPVFEAVCAG